VSVANVKSKPSHMSDMVTQTVMGWPVRVLGTAGGWHYVHTEPDGYLGWVEELQVTLVDEAGLRAWTEGARAIVTAPVAVATEAPAASATPVTDVVMGTLLRTSGGPAGWIAVELPDGRRGHVPAAAAQDYRVWLAATKPTAAGVERVALRFMGVPYLWGGTSSKGFDCSGYTKTVLRMNGIELPRDADQQGDTGTAVAIDDQMSALRKGDLLFFGSKATAERPERITHVGIYVGDGEFLHASGLVRRNSLLPPSPIFSESLRARLLRVRRVF
jgi:cell wall-associated NlpC family hydrolase